ncbi:MAG: preprotein translocase subunit SecE [Metamycoplasmataceae bacterium]
MKKSKNNPDIETIQESIDNENSAIEIKPYVMRNFYKELKRVKWPTEKKHNMSFLYIFIFILFLTGFFALISLGVTELIELMGAK